METTAGTRKRIRVYGHSWEDAHEKLIDEESKALRGIPYPAQSWKVAGYLDYWLENVAKPSKRLATYALYETMVRLYLKPGIHTIFD